MKRRIISMMIIAMLAVGISTGCTAKDKPETPGTTTGEETKVESGRLQEFYTAVKDAYGESYYPNMNLDATAMEEKFGIPAEDMTEFVADTPMISANVDTFVGIEAAPDKADAVEAKLNEYRDMLVADTMQYPMNIARINASKVVRVDNYVFFILLGDIPADDLDEAGQLKFAEEQNQIAIDAINLTAGK